MTDTRQTTPLDIQPMVWRLDWEVEGRRRPVEITLAITHLDDQDHYVGELRIEGHDAPTSTLPVYAVDWVQALGMLEQQVWFWLRVFHRKGRLFWRGTDVELAIPTWRLEISRLRRLGAILRQLCRVVFSPRAEANVRT